MSLPVILGFMHIVYSFTPTSKYIKNVEYRPSFWDLSIIQIKLTQIQSVPWQSTQSEQSSQHHRNNIPEV